MQKSQSRSQSREPFFESLCIGIKKFGLVKKVSVSKKALDRFDHNCFSNGCTQYFSLSGKYQIMPTPDYVRHPCPPGTEITSKSECKDALRHLGKLYFRPDGVVPALQGPPCVLPACFCLAAAQGWEQNYIMWKYHHSNAQAYQSVCRNC